MITIYDAGAEFSITTKRDECINLKSATLNSIEISNCSNLILSEYLDIKHLTLKNCDNLNIQNLDINSLILENCSKMILKGMNLHGLLGKLYLISCNDVLILASKINSFKVINGGENVIKDSSIKKITKKSTLTGVIKFIEVNISDEKSKNRVRELG